MLSILNQFWRIAQLKSGPEHLPASSFLLLLVTAVNIVLSLTISVSVGPQPASTVTTTILTNLAAQALLIFGLLYLVGKPARLTQTLIAYFGCDLLMNLVIGVSILIMRLLGIDFMTTLALTILFWSVLVFGYILHKAMEVHMAMTVALAFFLTMVTVALGQLAAGQTQPRLWAPVPAPETIYATTPLLPRHRRHSDGEFGAFGQGPWPYRQR